MAIALEADFRTIKTSQPTEPPERQRGKSGHGEEFASSLARARDADGSKDSPEAAPGTPTASPALPLPPVVTEQAFALETGAGDPALIQPLAADAAADMLKSEIIVDRQIVRDGVEVQAVGAADTEATGNADDLHSQAVMLASEPRLLASDAMVTAEPVTSTATQKPGEIAAQPAQAIEAGRNAGAATVVSTNDDVAAATVVMAAVAPPPAAAADNAKAPANRLTQIAEAPVNSDAFALAPQKAAQGIPLDANFTDAGIAPLTDVTAKGNPFDSVNLSSMTANGTQTLAAAAPAAPQSAASVPGLIATAPALAVVSASPAQIVGIVAESADDGQSDRVVVQLDPPELGRVSIDFKFDANGLQHVTITSETPEAMRQLRQMHSELVQSLERHGIGSENLSFQHQQQGSPQSPAPNPFARAAALGDVGAVSVAVIASTNSTPGARTLPGGRLDIRL